MPRLIKLVLLWPFARLGSVTWPAALNWEQPQTALFILYLKLEHGVWVVHGQEPLQPHRGVLFDIVADILGHGLKWPEQKQQHNGVSEKTNHSLDVDRSHVLEDSCAEAFAPVGHGAVLESPVEQDHVAGLA